MTRKSPYINLYEEFFTSQLSKSRVEESLERVLVIYRYLSELFQKALDVTDEEGDDVTNDIFVGAKAELEKTVWMLAAELGQAPGL
ncbi:DPS family peroxide resistance protein [Streptococcus pneumoniae]|nr:DPS family peroxide resistance protein [Streptococcus pneumoniae]VKH08065.1 DPS family peroxide resistance protein [Streptococcus pneumoniae]